MFDGSDLEKIKVGRQMLLKMKCYGCGQLTYHQFVYYGDPLSNLVLDPEKLADQFGYSRRHISTIVSDHGSPTGYSNCGPVAPIEIYAKIEEATK